MGKRKSHIHCALHDDGENRAQHGEQGHAQGGPEEHAAEADGGQNRAEAEKAGFNIREAGAKRQRQG
ncbi:hypothetical protein [Brucella ovis]|uniref:hypothetical protein n=1 Tax=Brucella ovis TaxID=236 RepID=UPI003D28ACCC